MTKFEFIKKALFFPEEGILAIGDLHLGYEEMFRVKGYSIPKNQIKETINELNEIIDEIKNNNKKLKKIIFMGDLKHFFSYERTEGYDFIEIYNFLHDKIKGLEIILIKGNHDTFDLIGIEMKDYYIDNNLCFTHGHKLFDEILSDHINTIVTSHLHPSVTLYDSQKIKKESYKCFLIGKWKNKEIIVIPSFFNIVEGTNILSEEYEKDFFIIPYKEIKKFNIVIVGEKENYNFGKVIDLIKKQE